METEHPNLVNVTIIGNSVSGFHPKGGGILCSNSSNPNMVNVSITGNSARHGGGIFYGFDSSSTLQNVTISGNNASQDGGGIYCEGNSSPSLVNCILWSDSPDEISGTADITYSDIQGGWTGDGNINEDPLFADPIEGDYHLTENSPCIDAGNPFSSPDPDSSRVDMGAYYFHHIGGEEEVFADFYADSTNVYMPLPASFNDLSVAFNTEITNWLWDFDNDGTIDSYEQNPSYTYEVTGYYSVSLTVEDDIGNSTTTISIITKSKIICYCYIH